MKSFEQTKSINSATCAGNGYDYFQIAPRKKLSICSDCRTKRINFIESGTA